MTTAEDVPPWAVWVVVASALVVDGVLLFMLAAKNGVEAGLLAAAALIPIGLLLILLLSRLLELNLEARREQIVTKLRQDFSEGQRKVLDEVKGLGAQLGGLREDARRTVEVQREQAFARRELSDGQSIVLNEVRELLNEVRELLDKVLKLPAEPGTPPSSGKSEYAQ